MKMKNKTSSRGIAKVFSIIMSGALFLLMSVSTHAAIEMCGDGGFGSQDIENLSASFSHDDELVTVEMTLCAAPDLKTKYRVRFDHAAPFANDDDRNGDLVVDGADFCVGTSDTGMMHRVLKGNNGPGQITVDGNVLTYTVSLAELNVDINNSDSILLWADTQYKGILDNAPDVDDSDGCGKPENLDEVIQLSLVEAVCSNGAVALSTSPDGNAMVCDDPTDATCEQDMQTLCPSGWNLCSDKQHNNRNDGWDFALGGGAAGTVLGEKYCRSFGGAGHHSLGPYDGITNLSQDAPKNCGYGTSRDSCTATYGCNEQAARALCCAPDASCGNGIVDSAEEECDDGNTSETDACLNSCSWRVPSAHGISGNGCG